MEIRHLACLSDDDSSCYREEVDGSTEGQSSQEEEIQFKDCMSGDEDGNWKLEKEKEIEKLKMEVIGRDCDLWALEQKMALGQGMEETRKVLILKEMLYAQREACLALEASVLLRSEIASRLRLTLQESEMWQDLKVTVTPRCSVQRSVIDWDVCSESSTTSWQTDTSDAVSPSRNTVSWDLLPPPHNTILSNCIGSRFVR